MLKLNYFLADIFILSAEKQPIKLSWRKIEWLLVHSVVFWANPLIAANATHSVINVFLIEIIIVCFLFSAKFDTESEKNMNFLMR